MGKKKHLLSTPKTSTIILEDSSEFLEGTLENLTISNNGYLMLESKFPSQPNWTNRTPSTHPGARSSHSMVYDSNHDKVILFGGDDDETWTYDLDSNTWTNMTPSTHPSARGYHSMAYDSINDKVILFGGDDGSLDDETWAYDLDTNTWTNMAPSTKPSARYAHSMVYDSNHDKVILFGGHDGSRDDETWAYDLDTNTWTNMAPSTKPSARYAHSMVYDLNYDKVILFGGDDGTIFISSDNETWAYDLDANTWTNMAPSTKPSERRYHSMVYDSNHDKVILFGGLNETRDDETWAYDLDTNTWTNMTPSTHPSARYRSSMAYDSINDKVILFGGWDGSNDDETWVFGLFEYYQTGTFDSKLTSLVDIYKISGEISWSPENQTVGTNLTIQIGFSNTINDEDFTYTRQYNSSFTFEGVARYFRYRVSFKSTNDLIFSPILKNIQIVYITEIESTQNIIYIDESEGDTIVSEDNLPAVIFIIGAICALALIIIALIKKITSLEKHIKLAGTDLKSKKIDKMKNVR